MKKKHLGKKTLSVFLAVMMLMTCWVWVAPEKASAAADVAPATTYATYHVKLTAKFTNIGDSGHIIIYYYPVNADGSLNTSVKGEYILVNSAAKYSSTTWTFDTADDSTRRLSTDTGAETGPVQGWPCGVKLKSVSSATLTLTGLTIGNKSVVVNGGSWGAGSGNTKEVLYSNTGSGWDGYLDWPVPSWSVSSDLGGATLQVPSYGTRTTGTLSASFKDQYGVTWPQNSVSYSINGTGATLSSTTGSTTVSVTNAALANFTNATGTTNLTLTASGAGIKSTSTVTLTAPKKEVLYDNMFSLSDWYYSDSSKWNDSNVTTDLNAGKVTVVYPSSAGGSEYVTTHSGGSSNANTRNTNHYAMPVVGGQEYTMKYTTDGAYTEMFAFFYDANGGCTHESSYGAYNFSVANGTGERTVKAPDGSAYMEIRFDNNTINTTANFWDIMIYPAAVKTENEVDTWTARPHRQLYNYKASVSSFDTPARPGYNFGGWKEDTDGDGTGDATASTGTITSSRVLYSTWTPSSYTVTFNADGGTASADTVAYTIESGIQLPVASKDSYALDSWKVTTADGNWISGDTYSAGQSLSGMYGNPTLTAQWTKLHTVTFLNGSGGTVINEMQVKNGQSVGTLPSVVPTKDPDDTNSYEFDYWYGNGAKFDESTIITSDITVYPVFKANPHTFVWAANPYKSATCDAPALVGKSCSGCGYSLGNVPYDGDNANWLAKGHDFTDPSRILKDGTATDTHHLVTCVRYGKDGCTATTEVEHTFTSYKTEGATCTTPGTVHWSCACGAEKTTTGSTAPDVHNYDLTTGTPNGDNETHTVKCTYNNAHTMSVACTDDDKNCVCDICDQELVHVYDNKTTTFVKSEADCLNDAVYYYTCQCGKQGTETWIDTGSMLAHNWTDTETYLKSAADCENDAVYYKECSRCDVSSKDITGDTWTKANTKWNHNFTGAYVNNNNGTHNRECVNENCTATGATEGCTYGDWTKDNADTHSHTCIHCSYTPAAEDHSWSAWASTDSAKQADGQHTRSCSVCDAIETDDCSYDRVETKVTCTADGYTTHTCTICSHEYVTAGATKTGHNYAGEVKSLNNGTHYYLCVNGCGTYGFEEVENATTTCTYEYKNNKDGEHQVTCTACKHTFAEECSGGQATCTAPATCEKCKTAYGATAPHSFTGTAVKLDGDKHAYLCEYCSTEGLYGVDATQGATQDCSGGTATCTTLAVCDVCKDTRGELDADAHKWGVWTNIAGTETHQRVCGYNAAHVQTEKCYSTSPAVASPDCNTEGFTLNTCEDCGHTWKTEPVAALGHNWGAWTDNGDGTHTRVCVRNCGYSDSIETASCTKDNATADVTEPTCTEQGYTTYTCNDCGHKWVADYVDATGHSFTKQTKKTDSKYQRSTKDCVTDWTYWYCCDECDVSAETEKDNYENEADLYWVREAATGHKFDKKNTAADYLATAATCTAKATYYYSCSVCGEKDTATFEYGSVLNHNWVQPSEEDLAKYLATAADCITDATYYYVCDRDGCGVSSKDVNGNTWTDVDSKSGHDFDYEGGYTAGVEANCTDTGVVEHYTCKTCGKHFKADKTTEIAADKLTIAALKHDYKDVAKKDATCEEAGYTAHKQCQREGCGYRNTDYKVIAALGHEYKAENGYYCDAVYNYHAYYCSRYDSCGAYGVDNVKYSVDLSGLDPEIRGGIKCEFTGEYVNYEDANGVHSHKLTCVCGNVSSAVCADEAPVHVLPTCTEAGYYIHTCDVCGYEWNVASDAEEDKALTHDLKIVSNNNGTHSSKCQREGCGYAEDAVACSTATPATECGKYDICDICNTAFGEAKPHVFTNYVYNNDAKCGVNGTKTAVCDTCEGEDKATDTIVAEGTALKHVMVEFADEDSLRYKSAGVWKYDNAFGYDLSKWAGKPADFDESTIFAPTCKNDGRAISYCTVPGCDHYVTKTAGKVDDGHIWGDETTVGGNCATGITIRTECTLCGKSTTRVETVEHTYVLHTYVPATCGEASLEYFVCSVCGDDKEEHKDEALGHDWATDVIEKEATCGQTGRKYSICSRCNAASEKTEIPRLNHVWDMNGDGITDAGFTPDMLDYDDGLYVEASEATCQFEGYAGYYKCYRCSYDQHLDEEWRKNNITEKKDHVDGNDDGKCDECNTKVYGEDGDKNCDCICHKDGWFSKIIYKILRFFWKLFGIGKSCDCGTVHY